MQAFTKVTKRNRASSKKGALQVLTCHCPDGGSASGQHTAISPRARCEPLLVCEGARGVPGVMECLHDRLYLYLIKVPTCSLLLAVRWQDNRFSDVSRKNYMFLSTSNLNKAMKGVYLLRQFLAAQRTLLAELDHLNPCFFDDQC